MKIVFVNEAKNVLEEYPIYAIYYSIENGRPIDIFIVADIEVLEAIEEYSSGANIRELEWFDYEDFPNLKGCTHMSLYGRLDSFKVEEG